MDQSNIVRGLDELEQIHKNIVDRTAQRGARMVLFIGFVMYVMGIACGATLMAVLG